jgi:hypothetical protein
MVLDVEDRDHAILLPGGDCISTLSLRLRDVFEPVDLYDAPRLIVLGEAHVGVAILE